MGLGVRIQGTGDRRQEAGVWFDVSGWGGVVFGGMDGFRSGFGEVPLSFGEVPPRLGEDPRRLAKEQRGLAKRSRGFGKRCRGDGEDSRTFGTGCRGFGKISKGLTDEQEWVAAASGTNRRRGAAPGTRLRCRGCWPAVGVGLPSWACQESWSSCSSSGLRP